MGHNTGRQIVWGTMKTGKLQVTIDRCSLL